MKKHFVLGVLVMAGVSGVKAAKVDVVQNEARLENQRLRSGGQVEQGTIVTGGNSRLQIGLGDQGSLVRAGSRTEAVLSNDRDLALSRGILLASSGGGRVLRETLNVETRETRQTVKGTMLIAYQPQAYIKITCIEGTVRVRLKSAFGEFSSIKAGQMLIINPAEKRLPEPVEVDLNALADSSALLGSDFPTLTSATRLSRAIDRQARAVEGGDLNPTNLMMIGASNQVMIDQGIEGQRDELISELTSEAPPPERPSSPRPSNDDENGGGGGGSPVQRFVIDSTTVFDPVAGTITTPGFGTITRSGGVYDIPTNRRGPADALTIGTVNIPVESHGDSTSYTVWGGEIINGTVTFGGSFTTLPDTLTIQNSTLNAPNGSVELQADGLADGPPQGDLPPTITIQSSVIKAGSDVKLNAFDTSSQSPELSRIAISSSTIESASGTVDLKTDNANGSSVSIDIQNSSHLLALASLGSIRMTTRGSQIFISNSELSATKEVLIDTMDTGGATVDSLVSLQNVQANADVIRARAFNSGGRDALLVDGGTFNARSLLRFYAEGASTLRFRGNVALNTPEAILAGRTVEVDPGGNVNISGRGTVYADDHRYNNNNVNGNINASQGLTRSGFAGRPAF